MRIIDYYIGRTVFAAILLVLFVVLGLDAISRIIEEIGDLEHQYTYLEALNYVLITLPGRIYMYLPFAAMIGCLAGLGMLANNSELVVMRSAGTPTYQLIWAVMKPAIVLMILGMLTGEFIAPHTERIAQSRRAILQHDVSSKIAGRGLWNREGNTFMHFNAVEPGGVLHGITLYSFNDERQLETALYAQRATHRGDGWLLETVSETRFYPDHTEFLESVTKPWPSTLTPELLSWVLLEAKDLSIRGLWKYAHYLGDQGLNNRQYWLTFWRKLLHPLSTASLVLIAISFVFGPLREVTMGFRIFAGVLIGLAFQTSQDLLAPASLVYGFQPIYATLVPIAICTAIGTFLLSRIR